MYLKVLLVEDSEELRAALKVQLEASGLVSVVEAYDGEMALQIVSETPFDFVISDIDMPKKNGLELLRELTQKYPQMPVIIMTGGDHQREKALSAGAIAFFEKPFLNEMIEFVISETRVA